MKTAIPLTLILLLLPFSPTWAADDEAESISRHIEALKDTDEVVREDAAEALRGFGPKAKTAVPKLIELLLKDPEPLVRIAAARALSGIDPDNETVILSLAKGLRDKHGVVARTVARHLARLGPKAKAAVPALVEAL